MNTASMFTLAQGSFARALFPLAACACVISLLGGCATTTPDASPAQRTVTMPNPTPTAPPAIAKAPAETTAPASEKSAPVGSRIVLNQVGYTPSATKVVLLVNPSFEVSGEWEITQARTGERVLSGQLGELQHDPHSTYQIYAIDASEITTPGEYRIIGPGTDPALLHIREDAHSNVLNDLVRSFYLQRCGEKIHDHVTGMQRPACHLNDGYYAHKDLIDYGHDHGATTGGWHDAGDYGKYVTTSSVAITEVLSRYEQFPDTFAKTELQIPESDNRLPDVLDQMRVGLDWLVSMQRSDGGIYRKLSGARWPKLVPPHEDKQKRFIYGPSTPDTAKAIASLALGARTFREHDAQASEDFLAAAWGGWHWLERHDEMMFDYREGDDSGSGPYRQNPIDKESSLGHDRDDRLAAAIELFLATGDQTILRYVAKHLPELPLNIYEWKDPSALSLFNFYWHPMAVEHADMRAIIEAKVLDRAQLALDRSKASGWALANHRFVWGSNKMAAQEGILMMQAWRMSGREEFRRAARFQRDYLLGRNPLNQSYVTGAGLNPVRNVAHILVRSTGQHIPGLMVGGPNEAAQAKIAPAKLGPLSYADDARSYATNEYAIDYTSSLIGLLVDLNNAERTPHERVPDSAAQ